MENKIQVIRLSSLGDVAMLIPVLLSFHQIYPGYTIVLYTRSQYLPLFADMNFVQAIAVNPKEGKIGWLNLWNTIQTIRQMNSSKIFLDMHGVLRTYAIAVALRLFGYQIYSIDKARKDRKKAIQIEPKNPTPLRPIIERYADVFRQAGFQFSIFPNTSLDMITPVNKGKEKWIGIAPFAKYESKVYPIDLMAKIVSQIAKNEARKIWIFGHGDKEYKLAMQYLGNITNVDILISPDNTLTQDLAIISHLDVMISMDSGNGHIAANYGVPVITLWGTTHPLLGFAPYGQENENWFFPDTQNYPYLPVSIYGKCTDVDYSRAIHTIDSMAVFRRVEEILSDQEL